NGNFTVDTAGNLVAKNANITGTINATSGTFSGSINVISTVTNPWGNYDTVKINPTYRFPIHIDDDESRHTYLSSGIVEIYYPAFSDTNTTSAKTTIEPSLITFSENDKTVSQITADAIYSIDYYNGQSTIISNGNAQFGNIAFNGAHSIISNDGGQLYFTNSSGDRIEITVKQVHADQWVMSNNMQVGYHTIQTNDNGDLWFKGANGNLIPIHIKSWTSSSKYDLKENFEKISPEDALQKILRTDVVSWNFKGDTEKHIGPIIGGGYSMDTSFIAENGEEKKSDDIVGALMLSTKALVNYHQELVLKIADLEARLAKLEA
ncbi:tail fiber domain-containing protein, partial [Cutibacterium acnes]|uniref:tail fiber domain-containing protein n=1 Tax=Cutibacterium acnes TaxID=1747 RepID=UPI0021D49A5B